MLLCALNDFNDMVELPDQTQYIQTKTQFLARVHNAGSLFLINDLNNEW